MYVYMYMKREGGMECMLTDTHELDLIGRLVFLCACIDRSDLVFAIHSVGLKLDPIYGGIGRVFHSIPTELIHHHVETISADEQQSLPELVVVR